MLDKTKKTPRLPSAAVDLRPYETFLIHEARLLDEGYFDDWLALFTEDARYWVPIHTNQTDPFETVSLMYDDRRLSDPRIYSQEPRSRTSQTVTNVTMEPDAGEPGVTVRSKFVLVEYRREDQRLFAGMATRSLPACSVVGAAGASSPSATPARSIISHVIPVPADGSITVSYVASLSAACGSMTRSKTRSCKSLSQERSRRRLKPRS